MSGDMISAAALRAGLSDEQRVVVETWGRGLAVVAGAGCGKTTTLTIKVAELLRRNPQAKFAAVSFTEKSATDLRAKLSTRLSDLKLVDPANPLAGHWVTTIHGLCASVLREHPREAGLDGEETMLSEPEAQILWNRAVDSLWSDTLPESQARDLDLLLERETQEVLADGLLPRMRGLEAYGLLARLLESPVAQEAALGRLGRYILDKYERLKRRRGVLDFNDLERGAARVLGNPEIRASYQARFDLVLIDEFQDTNPLQGDILWAFARPDQSNLCVVGDPKQSIYRFRDADVSVFEDFCARLSRPGEGPLVLTRNFRSRPGIIRAVNEICRPLFEESALRYDALVPGREEAPDSDDTVLKLSVLEPGELALWLKQEIASGKKLGDFCLLLRTLRNQGQKWLQALAQAGIPLAVSSGGLFWEDPRVREMVAFLKWWINPGHQLAGAIFLRAPWVGISDETLDRWHLTDPTFRKPFLESGHPIAERLSGYRATPLRPAELLLALCPDERVEVELGPALLGLWHRAEELSSQGNDLHTVVADFVRAVETGRRDRDVPPPRGAGSLTVLTIHGSKGLEFPHVLLVDFPEKAIPHRDYPLLYWDRARGARLAPRLATGERDKEDPVEQEWREIEKRLALAETKRLFYVALTRARERLVLVHRNVPRDPAEDIKSTRAKKEAEPHEALGQDFWRGWVAYGEMISREGRILGELEFLAPAVPGGSVPVPDAAAATRRVAPLAVPIRIVRPRHSVTEWSLLARCPRLFSWRVLERRPAERDFAWTQAQLDLSSPGAGAESGGEQEITQKELGTRVHKCLELRDWAGLARLEDEVGSDRFLAQPILDWAMQAPEMLPADEGSGCRVWSELSFELPVAGEILVGAIDRLISTREGGIQVVDFKVTRSRKESQDLLESYRTPMELYAWAVGRLEPAARDRISARLVAFSQKHVQSVEVPLPASSEELERRIESLARKAASLVAGIEPADPTPSLHCGVCEYRSECDAGRKQNPIGRSSSRPPV
jgi:ATP-dependent helicase/nuclease subunit A